jgi:hypothetical protein
MTSVPPPGSPGDKPPPPPAPLSSEQTPTSGEIAFASQIVGYPLKTSEDLKAVKGIINNFLNQMSTAIQHDMEKMREAIKKMREDEGQ